MRQRLRTTVQLASGKNKFPGSDKFGLVFVCMREAEPKQTGMRWLDGDKFVRLYRWLEIPDAPVHSLYTRAVWILMLMGQRVQEVAILHADHWDASEQIS